MSKLNALWARARGHVREYVARYAVLATAILTPVAGFLGTLAADLGGADTPAGRALLGAAGAIGTAIAAVTFIRNLGVWQMLDTFGTAPGAPPAPASGELTYTSVAGDVPAELDDGAAHSLTEGDPAAATYADLGPISEGASTPDPDLTETDR